MSHRVALRNSSALNHPVTNQSLSSHVRYHCSVFSKNCDERLADIRADHITVGLGKAPTACYVLVQSDGMKRRTRNKPVGLEKATEWKELIPL